MPFSHYYGLWKNIPHCLTQIQMGLAGRLHTKAEPLLKLIQALYQIERVAKERAEKKGSDTALVHARKEARRQSQKLVQIGRASCRERV